jgi:hypothetical protein
MVELCFNQRPGWTAGLQLLRCSVVNDDGMTQYLDPTLSSRPNTFHSMQLNESQIEHWDTDYVHLSHHLSNHDKLAFCFIFHIESCALKFGWH